MRLLILSRNPALYSTNSIAIAARRKGHHVRIIDHYNCDLVIDRYSHEVLVNGELIKGYDAIIPRIGSSVTNYGARVIRHFESLGIYTTLKADALLKSRDKLLCLQLLAAEFIPVPNTIISNQYDNLFHLSQKVGDFPLILKMLQGTHGLGVIKADNYSTAESIIEAFVKSKQKVILQEFIKESNGQDVRAFIVGGEVVAAMTRQAQEGEFRSNLHRGGIGRKIKLSDEENLIALKAAKTLGLSIAGVDLIRSNRGPLVMEVNASPGLEGIESMTKVNIAKKIIQFVERQI